MSKKNAQDYKIVGLTGGIASGKSTVSEILRQLGACIIDADVIARDIVMPDQPAWKSIVQHFGPEIILPDKSLNRPKLAEIIFNNPEQKAVLDNITHPLILSQMQQKTREAAQNNPPLLVWDVPLLFETGFDKYTDVSILVYVPFQIQLQRLMARNNLNENEALARINSQMPLQKKQELATITINNSGSLAQTQETVKSVFRELIL